MKNYHFLILYIITAFCQISLKAQDSNQENNYKNALSYINQKKYSLAMELLAPLTSQAEIENSISPFAHFHYGQAALKDKSYDQAKAMTLQLIQRFPEWKDKDEAYYLLGNIYFEIKNYRLAYQFINKITDKSMDQDIGNMKTYYLNKITIADTLINLQKSYPKDYQLAKVLVEKLKSKPIDEKNQMLLQYLGSEFKLDISSVPNIQSKLKPTYNIAILLPFQLNDLDLKLNTRPNQFVLDMYNGMSMAIDSLNKNGKKINIFAYDTEKDASIVEAILKLPELKTMDLIIGPIYNSQLNALNEFCHQNKIQLWNPLSINSKVFENKPYSFLFQSTLEDQAGSASSIALNYQVDSIEKKKNNITSYEKVVKKKVLIFYSQSIKDSLLAKYYKDSCTNKGFEVVKYEKITKENIDKLRNVIADSLLMQEVSHLFVSSSNEILAANILSAMEVGKRQQPIFVPYDWMNFTMLSYEQFERRKLHFIAPNFYDLSDSTFINFKQKATQKFGVYPSTYTIQGYEMMQFIGNQLIENGTYFPATLSDSLIQGKIVEGFNFGNNSHSNKKVSICSFKDKKLTFVKPLNLYPIKEDLE